MSPSNAAFRIRESAVKCTHFGEVVCLRRGDFIKAAFGTAGASPSSDVTRPPVGNEESILNM